MDAFYLTTEMNRGGVALSTIIENYFTAGLTDASRASYFLTNRLGGMVTKDGIRSKVLEHLYREYPDRCAGELVLADRSAQLRDAAQGLLLCICGLSV